MVYMTQLFKNNTHERGLIEMMFYTSTSLYNVIKNHKDQQLFVEANSYVSNSSWLLECRYVIISIGIFKKYKNTHKKCNLFKALGTTNKRI